MKEIFFKMADDMAAEVLNRNSALLLNTNEVSIHRKFIMSSHYVENDDNSCIFSKIVVKMAAENLKIMYLSSASRHKNKFIWHDGRKVQIRINQ